MSAQERKVSPCTVALLAGGVLLLGQAFWLWRRDDGQTRTIEVPAPSTRTRTQVEPVMPRSESIVLAARTLTRQPSRAMDVGDVDALRQLNEQYKREFPDDPQQLQDGYSLIAGCLDGRTDETRTRAEHYFDE